MKELTKAEEMVLLTILNLKENAYGVAMRRRIKDATGSVLPYGTLYFVLDQLANKGYVTRTSGESSSERGGRPRIFYTLSFKGRKALRDAYEFHQKIWKEYPKEAWEKGTEK